MENNNIITFCSRKPSQKNNIEAHENLLAFMNFKIQYQDRKVNALWQKLFNQH